MKIKEVHLKAFKRFSDTIIKDVPETAKLIVMAGPNGSGKSSFFEGLNVWSKIAKQKGFVWDDTYYGKLGFYTTSLQYQNAVNVTFHGGDPAEPKKAIYIRSAHRNEPGAISRNISRPGPAVDEDRLDRLIQNDATLNTNYLRLAGQAMELAFRDANSGITLGEFREIAIGEISNAVGRLFPDLKMNSLGDPFVDSTFRFDKGASKSFSFHNLSGGEKAAFDLLLDLVVKRREYDDTVFCIDEPEAHMNSRLQAKLLEELYSTVQDGSQLWLATHSAGMMRRARDIERASPGSVVFLDFGGRDFDHPQVLEPVEVSRKFWESILHVAFDDFAALMAPEQVVVCEGSKLDAGKKNGGDAGIYDRIFEQDYPNTRFVNGGNCHDVEGDRVALVETIENLMDGTSTKRLIDRDDRSEDEVADLNERGVAVLNRRNFECYLFDDEVVRRLYEAKGKNDVFNTYIQHKDKALRDAVDRGRPDDDIKAIAAQLKQKIQRDLSLTQSGSTTREFSRNVLAPHLRGTSAYHELRSVIFGSPLMGSDT